MMAGDYPRWFVALAVGLAYGIGLSLGRWWAWREKGAMSTWHLQPWWFKRLRLFLGIVWRMHEGARMTIECSWAVARVMHPRPHGK